MRTDSQHADHLRTTRSKTYKRSIYFAAADDGPIKIGMSCDPKRRLRELRTKTGNDLRLLAAIPTHSVGSFMEYRYHSRFAAHRLHGEWFARHPDILAEIERLNQADPARAHDGRASHG